MLLVWLPNLQMGATPSTAAVITKGFRKYVARVPVTKYQAQVKNNRYVPNVR